MIKIQLIPRLIKLCSKGECHLIKPICRRGNGMEEQGRESMQQRATSTTQKGTLKKHPH